MYRLLFVNSSFVIALALVVGVFITAKSYTQLGIAVVLYPLLILFTYKVFEDKIKGLGLKKQAAVHSTVAAARSDLATAGTESVKREGVTVADIDKRLFLKVIGATGLSFFLISIFGRRVENFLFGQNLSTQVAQVGKAQATSSSPTDGYTISEIDEGVVGYYGFINKEEAWFIMKRDTETGSFRYNKGTSKFPDSWKKRENLKYDYFHNVFVY